MFNHRTLAIALLAAATPLFPAHAASFDGSWTMEAATTRGHCGIIAVGLGISRGRIYSTSGSYAFNPIKLSGRVSSSGNAKMTAITGPRIAHGTGHFGRYQGKGTWNGTGPSGLCSGVWTANRG